MLSKFQLQASTNPKNFYALEIPASGRTSKLLRQSINLALECVIHKSKKL
jgi:hypothetical protein